MATKKPKKEFQPFWEKKITNWLNLARKNPNSSVNYTSQMKTCRSITVSESPKP